MKSLISIFTIVWITFLASCDNNVGGESDHIAARGIVVYSFTSNNDSSLLVSYFESETPQKVEIANNDTSNLMRIYFLNESREEFQPLSSDYALRITFGNNDLLEDLILNDTGSEKWDFKLIGKNLGNTDIKFRILHLNHDDFKSKSVDVEVK